MLNATCEPFKLSVILLNVVMLRVVALFIGLALGSVKKLNLQLLLVFPENDHFHEIRHKTVTTTTGKYLSNCRHLRFYITI